MKLIDQAPIIASILALAPYASANFHIGSWSTGQIPSNSICPSNHWNCQCFMGDRRYNISPQSRNLLTVDFWTAKSVCGVEQLNFYRRSNGAVDVYINNGDGKRVGECFRNHATEECLDGRLNWGDYYVCYSYICGE